jgi:hypothetical protein
MDPVDVVAVADFEGPQTSRFELCTLLFLAAWMEHRGDSRAWPLHLACIGAPPASVRQLASRAGALVSVHEPLLYTTRRTTNKLRGFEVRPQADRLLLLDVDILVLGDLAPLASLVGRGIGVGIASINYLDERAWRQIYAAADVPYPGPTGTCWCADPVVADARRLDAHARSLCLRMPPFFNSGVVMASWATGIEARWRDHMARITQRFSDTLPGGPVAGHAVDEELALATAVEAVRREGLSVTAIPAPYHARPLLLRAGVIRWDEVAVFHYHYQNMLGPLARTVTDLRAVVAGGHSPRALPHHLRGFPDFYEVIRRLAETHLHGTSLSAS